MRRRPPPVVPDVDDLEDAPDPFAKPIPIPGDLAEGEIPSDTELPHEHEDDLGPPAGLIQEEP